MLESPGLRIPEREALTPDGLRQHREADVAAMRAYNAGDVKRRMRSWTLPFLIQHSAFHTLDPAWEMEDKDLSAGDEDKGAWITCSLVQDLRARLRRATQQRSEGRAWDGIRVAQRGSGTCREHVRP